MTTSKLPARPSLESLRKQAKKLARDLNAGYADAVARARAHLPQAELPLSQRDAQLVLAREYGFAGWKDLIKEVEQRLGKGLEWAVSEARRRIHDNDVEGLRQLLVEYPPLLSWKSDEDDGGLLGMATSSYGDSSDPFTERTGALRIYPVFHREQARRARGSIPAMAGFCHETDRSRDARRRPDILCRWIAPRFMVAVGRVRGFPGRIDCGGVAERSRKFNYRSFRSRSRYIAQPSPSAFECRFLGVHLREDASASAVAWHLAYAG